MCNNKKKYSYLLVGIASLALVVGMACSGNIYQKTTNNIDTTRLATNLDLRGDYLYLSDLNYITENNWSYNGWSGHEIQKDKNQDGGILSLMIDGEKRLFAKGLGIHAKGQVTFDISEYSTQFPRFVAKLGVDAARGTNGSIWFRITASRDGETWDRLVDRTDTVTGASEALNIDLDVTGYKYLCIYVDPNGSNAADHGTIADARLVTKDFNLGDSGNYTKLQKLEYYDNILNANSAEENYNNNYRLILERELVRKLGYWNIQYITDFDTEISETLDWILSDNRRVEEVIEVGEISNITKFLTIVSDIYHQYQSELNSENGYVYEKMIIALAAGYTTDRIISPLEFSFPAPKYDYLERFEIMKDLFVNNKLKVVKNNELQGEFIDNEWFKDYHVELMRMVMQDGTSNGDLVWLNGFTYEKQSVSFYMMAYVSPVYTQDKYYAEENREKYDSQFYLSKYNVPYGLINGVKIPRYWMVFANGGIC